MDAQPRTAKSIFRFADKLQSTVTTITLCTGAQAVFPGSGQGFVPRRSVLNEDRQAEKARVSAYKLILAVWRHG